MTHLTLQGTLLQMAAKHARQLEVSLAPKPSLAGFQLTKIPGAYSNLLSFLLSASQGQGGGFVWAAVSLSYEYSCGMGQMGRFGFFTVFSLQFI
jgi:hypothetical protein